MALNYVTVTGTFDDGSGTPLNGPVTFTPSETVYASGIPVVSTSAPIVAQVINGLLKSPSGGTLQLLATDNAGLSFEGLTGFFYWNVSVGLTGQSWAFFLPSSPSSVDLYSLASTAAGGGGFTSPMTTLGDMIYENATPAAARLAGSTSASKRFLTQAGTGTVSAAPAWGAIAASDLPAALKPWQFWVDDPAYGAKGDGVVCTVNTNGTTTIVATSPVFTSTAVDGGKYIMIHGGNGTANAPFVGQISTVTNATTAVLGSAPSSTINGCPAVFGTDDTAAINAAVTAAGTYATTAGAAAGSGKYYAEVLFGPKVYVLATGPTQTGNGTTTPTFNAQIPLPYPNANGTTQKLIIAMTGVKGGGFLQFWESLVPNLSGTSLVSMTSAPSTPSATFGKQSVIGGPSGSSGFTGSFANVKAVIDGISVWCPIFTNQIAFDLGYVAGMRAVQSGAHIFAPTGVNSSAIQPWLQSVTATQFLNSLGIGWRTPVGGNNADVTADDLAAEGYEIGFLVFDHFNAGKLNSIYCDVALKNDGTQGLSGTQHGIFIQSITAEVYNGGFRTNGGSLQVDINWDAEGTPSAYDLSDASNSLFGYFRFGDKIDNRAPIVASGGSNLKVINTNLGPGAWSGAPAAPASTVSQQNTAWRDAWITLSATTGITVVSVDGVTTGLTAGNNVAISVRVPAGKSYAVTYTGALTAKWWLD